MKKNIEEARKGSVLSPVISGLESKSIGTKCIKSTRLLLGLDKLRIHSFQFLEGQM